MQKERAMPDSEEPPQKKETLRIKLKRITFIASYQLTLLIYAT